MKKAELWIIQRIIAVLLYTGVFLFACYYFNDQSSSFLFDSNNKYNLIFVSGALLLVFWSYIAEPFFTKPVDVLTNSTAIILALLSVNEPEKFVWYSYILYSAFALLFLSVIVVLSSKIRRMEVAQKVLFEILTKFGQSKIIFSFIYIATVVSYFGNSPIEFSFFITFWIILITQFVIEEALRWLTKLYDYLFHRTEFSEILGQAIWCENPFLYKVEVDYFKHTNRNTRQWEMVYLSLEDNLGAIGIVINEKQLLNKKWITVYLLEHENAPLKVNIKTKTFVTGSNTIFSQDSAVYPFDLNNITDEDTKGLIEQNYLYKNKESFVWYVVDWSDLNKVKFHSLVSMVGQSAKLLKEWAILKIRIYWQETLFQVIDWKTGEEELEKHNTYGYLTWIAHKLGKYDSFNNEISTVKWLPDIYSPVFFDHEELAYSNPDSIWKLPLTNLEIVIKDARALVTHNTAILGILGIWKSCLTFELIQKVVKNTDAKVICIDITNEYQKELPSYIDGNLIQIELPNAILSELKANNRDWNQDNPQSWGNEALYQQKLEQEFKTFSEGTNRVLLLNPDWHAVSKAGSSFRIQHKVDLTIAEKTRIISERLFLLARSQWDALNEVERGKNNARYLLVFEEAHSLIPEWNSTANSGDWNASNGTAKIILQGRKYWLWSFVVTQRTANISKSILNQCNTIFALRVFDDTWKQFLENYIWSDYSNTLPTLEERHAIVVWKALKLRQPVIIELNDRKDIILSPNETNNNSNA